MKFPKIITVIAVGGVIASQSVYAGNFYAGAGLGIYKDDVSSSDFDKAFAQNGFATDTSIDGDDYGWNLYGGYRFNPYVSLELGMRDFGEVQAKTNVFTPISGAVKTTSEVDGVSISVNLGAPITEQFDIFGKLGYMSWDADISSRATFNGVTNTVNKSEDGTDFIWGLGMAYKFTDNASIRGDWDRLSLGSNLDTDYDAFSVSFQYDFK